MVGRRLAPSPSGQAVGPEPVLPVTIRETLSAAAFRAADIAYAQVWRLAWPGLRLIARLRPRWGLRDRVDLPPTCFSARPSPATRFPFLWLHAASVGEAKAALRLAAGLAGDGQRSLLVTTHTRAGLRTLQTLGAPTGFAEVIFRLAPGDAPFAFRRLIAVHRIRALIVIETEWWPGMLGAVRQTRLPWFGVGVRLPARSWPRYRPFRFWLAPLLSGCKAAWLGEDQDPDPLRALGLRRLRPGLDSRSPEPIPPTWGGRRPAPGWSFVSVHARELPWLLPGLRRLPADCPVRIFPRHMAEIPEFEKTLAPLGFRLHSRQPGARRSLVDAMGLVEALLPDYAEAFLGGSWFPCLGHNLFEPLAAGVRVHIGPHFAPHRFLTRRLQVLGFVVRHNGPFRPEAVRETPTAPDPERLRKILRRRAALAAVQRRELARAVDTAFSEEAEFASFPPTGPQSRGWHS